MELFKEAKPEMAFLKMGIYGEAGSGKTHTSAKVAIGLHRFIGSKKPIGFLDTETGSDFVLPMFEEAKVKLMVTKTRAFKDLLKGVDVAEENCSILIIDSITHFWNEMVDAYCDQHNIANLTLRHWQPIKHTWREFTRRYIKSKLHVIMAGRAADKWEDVEDEEGVKELKKVGTKMRAETEISYEPSLLVEMEQARKSAKAGAGWINRAWIVKDRFNAINGCFFDYPGLESFLPHIELLNLGGDHKAIEDSSSREMFTKRMTGADYYRRRDELVENIKSEILIAYPQQNSDHKVKRLDLMKEIFDSRSWKEIEHMKNDDLEVGLAQVINYNEAEKEPEQETKPEPEPKSKKKEEK